MAPEAGMPSHGRRAVGAIIRDPGGRIFIQRRSFSRSFLPGAWDIVGGHLEPGEAELDGLAREVREETGWPMTAVDAELGTWTWTDAAGRPITET